MTSKKTEYYTLEGIAAWAKVFENWFDEYGGKKKWVIDLYMDPEEWKKYEEIGLRLRPFGDRKQKPLYTEGGVKGVRFSREFERKFGNGDVVKFEPPEVVDANGEPFTDLIGNGSRVKVNIEVYDAGEYGKGHRLMGVKIIDNVPYERPEEEDGSKATSPTAAAGARNTNVSRKVKVGWD